MALQPGDYLEDCGCDRGSAAWRLPGFDAALIVFRLCLTPGHLTLAISVSVRTRRLAFAPTFRFEAVLRSSIVILSCCDGSIPRSLFCARRCPANCPAPPLACNSFSPIRKSINASSCFYLGKSVEQLKSFHFRPNSIFARSFFSAAA